MKRILNSDWIRPFLKKYRFGLLLAIALGLLTMLCAGLLMFSAGYVISKSATKPENILMIYVPVLFVRIFGISRPVVRYIERLTSHNWILRLTSDLRKRLYLRLEVRAVQLSQEFQLGDMLGILNQDIANLQDLYLRTLFPVLIAGTLTVALVLSSAVFNMELAAGLAFFLGLLLVVVPLISVKRLRALDSKLKIHRNQLFTELTDAILGLQDWVLSGRKSDFLSAYTVAEKSVRKEQKRVFSFVRTRGLILQLIFGSLVVFLLAVSTGFLSGGDKPNYIAALVLMIFPLFDAYAPLSDALVETERYADSADRLEKLPHALLAAATEKPQGTKIELSALTFGFGTQKIFEQLNLTIQPGEKLAILGRSGVGKSTLAGLIRGDLTPSSGTVTIGAASSSQISEIERTVGVINQSPYLFATTLRNNLTLAKLDATDAEIWRALEIVGLAALTNSLAGGLDTPVSEAGTNFSGGERQRLALARILLSDVPIVVLDEPTVSLDPITENQLLTLFYQALADKTVILITHHLLGIHHSERVIFLENKTIKSDGAPDELLLHDETFRELYRLDKGLD
ncbi:MAG: thiol reductant ABC exporter subunit CydC [Streptococcaceae bacterium]|jgi:ATP-binding cassette subfamily C protein CydC|nr:thiol reductant ABC exporter subunit CydC [Streptococcaceae bacterium]